MEYLITHKMPTRLLAQCVEIFYSSGGRKFDLPRVLDTLRVEYDEVVRDTHDVHKAARISRVSARQWRQFV